MDSQELPHPAYQDLFSSTNTSGILVQLMTYEAYDTMVVALVYTYS